MLKRFFSLVVSCIFLLTVQSQPEAEFITTSYTEINGVTTRSISDMLQGRQGYLWFASYQGLIRYDGYSFKLFTNTPGCSNSIQKMAEDRNGNIWLALTDGTLAEFNVSNSSFYNLKINFPNLNTQEKPGGIESVFFDKENVLWLGISRTGLAKIDVTNGNAEVFDIVPLTDYFFTPEIRKFYNRELGIYEDEKGLFWMSTPDGLYLFNKQTHDMKQISHRPQLPTGWRNDNYRTVLRHQNKLWLASFGGGLNSYDLSTGRIEVFKYNTTVAQSVNTNCINSVIESSDSTIFLGTSDKGFIGFNLKARKFFEFDKKIGLPDKKVVKIIKDKDNNFWVLYLNGLMKVEVPNYKFKFHAVAYNNSVQKDLVEFADVYDDKEVRLLAPVLGDGLIAINKKTGIKTVLPVEYLKTEDKASNVLRIKTDSQKNIWILSRDFVYRYDKKTNQLFKTLQPTLYQNFNSNIYSELTIDTQNILWFATIRNGLFAYDPLKKSFTHFYNEPDSEYYIPTNSISSVVADEKGRVWIASGRGFVSYYDNATKQIQSRENINKILNGLYDEKIIDMFKDSKGFLWLSSRFGLIKIDVDKPQPKFVKKYTIAEGLNSENIVGLEEDDFGNIWGIQTDISSVCILDVASSKVINYGIRDGINHYGELSRVKKVGNKMWVLAQGGYYEFDPLLKLNVSKEQKLVVSIMAVNSIDKHFEEEIATNGKVLLKPEENSFYFEFAVIDFNRPELYQYAYMLEGFDTGWIYSGNRHAVSYTNIPGGNYVFKVRATTLKKQWTDKVVRIPFFIETPFYKKWWFIILSGILMLAAFYFFYRNQLKKQQHILQLETKAHALGKEKSKVQYENLKQHLNPHFLFNSLTSLSSLIRIDEKMAIDFLDSMSKIYRYILQSKDEELVYLKDEIKFVETFIHLQKTRFGEGLQVKLNVEEKCLSNKIVPVTLQNLIENALKHNIIDVEYPLTVEIFVEDDFLIVRNNLQKKKFVETSNKQGLDNLTSLYQYLSDKPLTIEENNHYFIIKIPLI